MREPDFENLLKILRREKAGRPTLFEFSLNEALCTELSGMRPGEGRSYERRMKAFKAAGYDYVTANPFSSGFPKGEAAMDKTISLNDGAVIHDRATFESYPWPDLNSIDYLELERAESYLPDGMKLIVTCPGGLLENVIRLVGYDSLCFLLADDHELAKGVFDKAGECLRQHCRNAASFRSVGALIVNDDWGFKTQPMLAPSAMRELVVPWHKRMVEEIHAAGKPAILHSCGKTDCLTDDIIDVIRFDAKHSYEDAIEPVEDAYAKLRARISVLGGIDLDFLCRQPPERVKARSIRMLEATGCEGYALGSGNSIPDYVPWQNYFAMTSAALGS